MQKDICLSFDSGKKKRYYYYILYYKKFDTKIAEGPCYSVKG